jgi:phosphoserine aminotransferase
MVDMTALHKPDRRPARPFFSSGPCAKIPGWSPQKLQNAIIGRSHRSSEGKARLKEALARTREVLKIPESHLIAIVPGSDTGAVELALWTMLGQRGVDMLAWESFGLSWVNDVLKQLRIADVRVLDAPYGMLPDLSRIDPQRDIVFAWNGTTSGVRVPDANWIPHEREGLTICDATSAVFAQALDFSKLDAVTFSWQKVLGGEAAHGMLVLSPRAVQRLESYVPPWPLPKIFRLTQGGKLNRGLFDGETLNTPSMLCVEDWLACLDWARSIGGIEALIAHADKNAGVLGQWVERTPWIEYLAKDPRTRSNTSVCLTIRGSDEIGTQMAKLLAQENVAYDIAAHRDSPPGLRIWCGSTVETEDIEALLQWLDWAHAAVTSALDSVERKCR